MYRDLVDAYGLKPSDDSVRHLELPPALLAAANHYMGSKNSRYSREQSQPLHGVPMFGKLQVPTEFQPQHFMEKVPLLFRDGILEALNVSFQYIFSAGGMQGPQSLFLYMQTSVFPQCCSVQWLAAFLRSRGIPEYHAPLTQFLKLFRRVLQQGKPWFETRDFDAFSDIGVACLEGRLPGMSLDTTETRLNFAFSWMIVMWTVCKRILDHMIAGVSEACFLTIDKTRPLYLHRRHAVFRLLLPRLRGFFEKFCAALPPDIKESLAKVMTLNWEEFMSYPLDNVIVLLPSLEKELYDHAVPDAALHPNTCGMFSKALITMDDLERILYKTFTSRYDAVMPERSFVPVSELLRPQCAEDFATFFRPMTRSLSSQDPLSCLAVANEKVDRGRVTQYQADEVTEVIHHSLELSDVWNESLERVWSTITNPGTTTRFWKHRPLKLPSYSCIDREHWEKNLCLQAVWDMVVAGEQMKMVAMRALRVALLENETLGACLVRYWHRTREFGLPQFAQGLSGEEWKRLLAFANLREQDFEVARNGETAVTLEEKDADMEDLDKSAETHAPSSNTGTTGGSERNKENTSLVPSSSSALTPSQYPESSILDWERELAALDDDVKTGTQTPRPAFIGDLLFGAHGRPSLHGVTFLKSSKYIALGFRLLSSPQLMGHMHETLKLFPSLQGDYQRMQKLLTDLKSCFVDLQAASPDLRQFSLEVPQEVQCAMVHLEQKEAFMTRLRTLVDHERIPLWLVLFLSKEHQLTRALGGVLASFQDLQLPELFYLQLQSLPSAVQACTTPRAFSPPHLADLVLHTDVPIVEILRAPKGTYAFFVLLLASMGTYDTDFHVLLDQYWQASSFDVPSTYRRPRGLRVHRLLRFFSSMFGWMLRSLKQSKTDVFESLEGLCQQLESRKKELLAFVDAITTKMPKEDTVVPWRTLLTVHFVFHDMVRPYAASMKRLGHLVYRPGTGPRNQRSREALPLQASFAKAELQQAEFLFEGAIADGVFQQLFPWKRDSIPSDILQSEQSPISLAAILNSAKFPKGMFGKNVSFPVILETLLTDLVPPKYLPFDVKEQPVICEYMLRMASKQRREYFFMHPLLLAMDPSIIAFVELGPPFAVQTDMSTLTSSALQQRVLMDMLVSIYRVCCWLALRAAHDAPLEMPRTLSAVFQLLEGTPQEQSIYRLFRCLVFAFLRSKQSKAPWIAAIMTNLRPSSKSKANIAKKPMFNLDFLETYFGEKETKNLRKAIREKAKALFQVSSSTKKRKNADTLGSAQRRKVVMTE